MKYWPWKLFSVQVNLIINHELNQQVLIFLPWISDCFYSVNIATGCQWQKLFITKACWYFQTEKQTFFKKTPSFYNSAFSVPKETLSVLAFNVT